VDSQPERTPGAHDRAAPASTTPSRPPRPAVVEHAVRVIESATQAGLALRLAGGVAVALHTPPGTDSRLTREPKDIDLVTDKRSGPATTDLLTSLGYVADVPFNAINGHRRLLFTDPQSGLRVDVFVGQFAMCHELPITARLTLETRTLPLAELLAMKLQIYELNEKDQRDILNLLICHPVADHDELAINGAYLGGLYATDWGLWRTAVLNLQRTHSVLDSGDLSAQDSATGLARVAQLTEHLERAPKSRRWKLRARVGDRVRWYEDVEEVE
jgi:hypothetical protein